MDSVTQLALGAAVGVAVMGRRTAPWKAALVGAVAGTLPDLDVFIDHGDPVANMVLHRAASHALFWLSLAAPWLGVLAAWAVREAGQWRAWAWAVWGALITHPLLDALTVYGTQLALPFTDHPVGLGSVFIIDPLVTLPLLVGTGVALARRGGGTALRANAWGLGLALAYLAWGVAVQQHVRGVAERSLAAQGIAAERLLVTPAPLQTVLWRVVAVSGDAFHEGFYSLPDEAPSVRFERFERGLSLAEPLRGHPPLEAIARFSHGFYKLSRDGEAVRVHDLRMGQEPHYVFAFVVGRAGVGIEPVSPPTAVGGRGDAGAGLRWLWARLWGAPLPPPR
jgi:inner membrane protein